GGPDSWLLENPGFGSGGNLRWWRDHFFGPDSEYDAICRPAADVAPGAEGLVFLPCLQGAMAPEWNGAARGVFYGLSLAHTRAHLLRALLEGSAFALRDILEAMRGAGLGVQRITIVGGGAKGPLWRQIKADVTGLPVRVPTNVDTTAAGAATLATVGSGACPNRHEPVGALHGRGGSYAAVAKNTVRGECAAAEDPRQRAVAGMRRHGGRRDRQHRALGMGEAVAAHPAGEDPGQHAAAACPDDEQVGRVAGDDGKDPPGGAAGHHRPDRQIGGELSPCRVNRVPQSLPG